MAHAVGDIVELVGPDDAVGVAGLQLLGQAAGHLHVIARIPVGDGGHLFQLRAGEAQHVLLLLGLGLRDHDQGLVAARIADQRQADARIAGCPLDDQATLAELTLLLGILDDEERGTVLHRAAGIEELRLAQDRAAGQLRRFLEPDERGIADRADEPVADIHANSVGDAQKRGEKANVRPAVSRIKRPADRKCPTRYAGARGGTCNGTIRRRRARGNPRRSGSAPCPQRRRGNGSWP